MASCVPAHSQFELHIHNTAAFFRAVLESPCWVYLAGVTSNGQPWVSTRRLASMPWIWAAMQLSKAAWHYWEGSAATLKAAASVGSLLPICGRRKRALAQRPAAHVACVVGFRSSSRTLPNLHVNWSHESAFMALNGLVANMLLPQGHVMLRLCA